MRCGLQQRQRIDVDAAGQPLQAAEGQIALAAFDSAHIRPVDAENLGESLLAQAAGLSKDA